MGTNLDYVANSDIRITGEYISEIKKDLQPRKTEKVIDCEGLLIIPGLINSHTHVGDSIAKDVGIDSGVETKIHPVFGFKQKILKNSNTSHLTSFIRNSCISMIRRGITTFVDFREGGIDGVKILKNAISGIPIRPIILGRIEYYQDQKSIKKKSRMPESKKSDFEKILRLSDGLGISGPNEYSDHTLRYFSTMPKICAIHSGETKESMNISKRTSGLTETQRALLVKPRFLVHMTYATKMDLRMVSQNNTSIVVCPRANGALAEGIPKVSQMLDLGCNVAIGTDNVMINSPDLFKEMDYLWKVSMGMSKNRLPPKEILKMTTVNPSHFLDQKIGIIQRNKIADCIFVEKHSIDLEPMYNPYASIVQRMSENTIRAVMFGGKIVHGKI